MSRIIENGITRWRSCSVEYRHDFPVILELKPLTLARVPITGDTLQESVLLHPRYVPASVEHEIISVRGYRRGRTVDVLLDEPLEINGTVYGVLNFKGFGADCVSDSSLFGMRLVRESVIHPNAWWDWYGFEEGSDSYGRIWGAVSSVEAQKEYGDVSLNSLALPFSPYLAVHDIPKPVCDSIQEVERTARKDFCLGQIIRAERTNIRESDFSSSYNFWSRNELGIDIQLIAPKRLAEIDGEVIKTFLALAEQGKMLAVNGSVAQNRFMDGMFTDKENYTITHLEIHSALKYLCEVVLLSSVSRFLNSENVPLYFSKLGEKTGINFNSFRDNGDSLKSFLDVLIPTFQKVCGKNFKINYNKL